MAKGDDSAFTHSAPRAITRNAQWAAVAEGAPRTALHWDIERTRFGVQASNLQQSQMSCE